jgi:ribosome-binding protein aMBF1 (putative translation factor)
MPGDSFANSRIGSDGNEDVDEERGRIQGLTTRWGTTHTVTGGAATTRSYEEFASDRRAKLSASAAADRLVFEEAYDIALQIVGLRESAGLTQAELAERCGIDHGDISRIERGVTSPTARTLQRIARALDADVRLVARSG